MGPRFGGGCRSRGQRFEGYPARVLARLLPVFCYRCRRWVGVVEERVHRLTLFADALHMPDRVLSSSISVSNSGVSYLLSRMFGESGRKSICVVIVVATGSSMSTSDDSYMIPFRKVKPCDHNKTK